MNLFLHAPARLTIAFMPQVLLLVCALLVSGCSGSSGSAESAGNAPDVIGVDESEDNTGSDSVNSSTGETPEQTSIETTNGDESAPSTEVPDSSVLDSDVPQSTRVTFDITVPVYASDTLQIRLVWGELDTFAAWVVDESWTLSEDFPKDTDSLLTRFKSQQINSIPIAGTMMVMVLVI